MERWHHLVFQVVREIRDIFLAPGPWEVAESGIYTTTYRCPAFGDFIDESHEVTRTEWIPAGVKPDAFWECTEHEVRATFLHCELADK